MCNSNNFKMDYEKDSNRALLHIRYTFPKEKMVCFLKQLRDRCIAVLYTYGADLSIFSPFSFRLLKRLACSKPSSVIVMDRYILAKYMGSEI